jgi:hypothetical protein
MEWRMIGAPQVVVEYTVELPVLARASPHLSAAVTCNALNVTINWATATDGYGVTLTPP